MVLVTHVEHALLDVGPKFIPGVGRHASGEVSRRPHERALCIGFAVNALGVGKEVISEFRHVAGIRGSEAAVVAPGCEAEL